MLFGYIVLKWEIDTLNDFADNMLEYRTGSHTGLIRKCGYVEDYELKLKKRYPKTYMKYEEAKKKWLKAYDDTEEAYNAFRLKREYETIVEKQNRLDIMEKEISILKKEIDILKKNV